MSGLVTTGCIDIEQTLTLERNMSGTAGFTMKVDMEPMVAFMAAMQKSMQGKAGEPTAAELAAVRREILESKKAEPPTDFEKDKKEFEGKLPPGVKLLNASFKEDGLKIAVAFVLGFDQAAKLAAVRLPKKDDPGGGRGGTPDNPVESPFGGLRVVEEGATLLITSPVENPVADQQAQAAQMSADPAMLKQMESMFKGLRVAFRITAPFDVADHTAHRREGNTLVWEYNVQNLQKLTPDQMKQGVRVRYRKSPL
jgi:hypothetical protein